MNRLITILLLTMFCIVCNGQTNATKSEITKDKKVENLLIQLKSAYKTLDLSKLTVFLDEWIRDVESNKLDSINKNKDLKMVHEIYKAFYTPLNFDGICLNPKGSCNTIDREYIIIQNKITYSIELDSNTSRKNTITSFRPRLKIANKKILYLTDEYNKALRIFSRSDYEVPFPKPPYNDARLSDKKTYGTSDFIRMFLPISPEHCGIGWKIETPPHVYKIEINKELNKAVIRFAHGYEGGYSVLKKEKGKWIVKETEWTWIS